MKKRQKVYLSDVAKLAKVSSSAAGKVLNGGSDQIRVGAEARKRILEAAKQLDYRPNMAASIPSPITGHCVSSGKSNGTARNWDTASSPVFPMTISPT